MKRILLTAVIAGFTLGLPAQAQQSSSESTSDSRSQSQAGAQAGAASQSGVTQIYNNSGSSEIRYSGEIKNAPAVQAPAVFGGGHPCLAGKSGGVSVVGGGFSYGQGDPEVVCMLWVMGQPEAAVRALVMSNATACEALNNVGYYRVGNQVVPFRCGDTVAGGIDTAGVQSKRSKVTTSTKNTPTPNYGYSKCEKGPNNTVKIKYKYGVDKEVAKSNCLLALGY